MVMYIVTCFINILWYSHMGKYLPKWAGFVDKTIQISTLDLKDIYKTQGSESKPVCFLRVYYVQI